MAVIEWIDKVGIEPASFEFSLRFNTHISASSAIDGSISAIALPGSRWMAKFSYSYQLEKDADVIEAFMARLEGQANQVLLGHPRKRRSRGTMGNSTVACVLAQSVAQGDSACVVQSTGGAFKTLVMGDMFQLNDRLYRLTQNATANAAGVFNLEFQPRIPAALPSGIDVFFERPEGLFVAQQPEYPLTYREKGIDPFSIDFVSI